MSFLALSGRESSLVQTFCESCVQFDITHPSVHITQRSVIQGCPTLKTSVYIFVYSAASTVWLPFRDRELNGVPPETLMDAQCNI